MEKKIFGNIPMRTWRWLGVNEARAPEHLDDEIQNKQILIERETKERLVLAHRARGNYEVQIHLEPGACLDLVLAQLVPPSEGYTCRVRAHVADGASFSATICEAGAKETVTELFVDLAGKEAKADVWALYFGDGAARIDMNYVIRQKGRMTDANLQVRGALAGESTKVFRGTLDFLEGSTGSIGREDETVMLLSPKVRNRSVPIMLSHEADVDGHHAVSVGKMDEEKLFYLMSRGLSLSEAQRLVVEAAFHPVLDRIGDKALREEIEMHLMRRLRHAE